MLGGLQQTNSTLLDIKLRLSHLVQQNQQSTINLSSQNNNLSHLSSFLQHVNQQKVKKEKALLAKDPLQRS